MTNVNFKVIPTTSSDENYNKDYVTKQIPRQLRDAKKSEEIIAIYEKLSKVIKEILDSDLESTQAPSIVKKKTILNCCTIKKTATYAIVFFIFINAASSVVVSAIDKGINKDPSSCDSAWASWTKLGLEINGTIASVFIGLASIWRDIAYEKELADKDRKQSEEDIDRCKLRKEKNDLLNDANNLLALSMEMIILNKEKNEEEKKNLLKNTYILYNSISVNIKAELPPEDFIPSQIINNFDSSNPLFKQLVSLNQLSSQINSKDTEIKNVESNKESNIEIENKNSPIVSNKLEGEEISRISQKDLKKTNFTVYNDISKEDLQKQFNQAQKDFTESLSDLGWKAPLDKILFHDHYIPVGKEAI